MKVKQMHLGSTNDFIAVLKLQLVENVMNLDTIGGRFFGLRYYLCQISCV